MNEPHLILCIRKYFETIHTEMGMYARLHTHILRHTPTHAHTEQQAGTLPSLHGHVYQSLKWAEEALRISEDAVMGHLMWC